MKTRKPDVTHTNLWEGKIYKFDLFKANSFKAIKNANQVYGIVIDKDNKMLIVAGKTKNWILPGGTVEKSEKYITTLNREVYEEAAVSLDQNSIQPLFYQKIYSKTKTGWKYFSTGVRYFANVKQKRTFESDPDGHVKYNKWIKINRLDKYLKWGKTTEFIKNFLL